MANRKEPDEIDISWRTRELGPEIRRALFKKAMPSVKFASAKETPPRARDQAHPEEPPMPKRVRGQPRDASPRQRGPRRGERGSS